MQKPTSLAKLINPDDLKSARHYIFLKNETSKTELLDCHALKLIEVSAQEILLDAPATCANLGHQLQLYFLPESEDFAKLTKLPQPQHLSELVIVIGVVEEFERTSLKERAHLRIKLTQLDSDQWDSITSTYSDRVEKIDQIISNAKGSE
jgi:hypothetical protein